MNLPTDKKYSVIYCDPPWWYNGRITHNGNTLTGSSDTHYPTMKLDELKALDVKSLAEKNCCLFMWVGSPKLDQAIELGTHWGFKYKTVAFVWYKERPNVGYYTLSECEICLVFTRGSIPKNRGTRNERQFLSEKRSRRHSEKPHEIRERIGRMFPAEHHNRIELFARHNTDGWDTWGNDENLL
jgi:N6-adenosine-specific RNA methylase IME4